MNIHTFLLITILLSLSSCKRDSETAEIRDLYNLRGITFDNETENIIVLPETGCGGCIAGGISFLLDNIDKFSCNQSKNLVVFTSIKSRKRLLRNLRYTSLDSLNCIVDSADIYKLESHNKIYPLAISVKDGVIQHAAFQSPQTKEDIFSQLNL